MYEAAEGHRPFADEDPVATMLSVLHHDPEPAVGGTLLGGIVDGLLVKDPRHRLTAHEAYALFKEAESEVIRSTVQAVRAGARPSGPQAVEAA